MIIEFSNEPTFLDEFTKALGPNANYEAANFIKSEGSDSYEREGILKEVLIVRVLPIIVFLIVTSIIGVLLTNGYLGFISTNVINSIFPIFFLFFLGLIINLFRTPFNKLRSVYFNESSIDGKNLTNFKIYNLQNSDVDGIVFIENEPNNGVILKYQDQTQLLIIPINKKEKNEILKFLNDNFELDDQELGLFE